MARSGWPGASTRLAPDADGTVAHATTQIAQHTRHVSSAMESADAASRLPQVLCRIFCVLRRGNFCVLRRGNQSLSC
jgi:hypothetical protein